MNATLEKVRNARSWLLPLAIYVGALGAIYALALTWIIPCRG